MISRINTRGAGSTQRTKRLLCALLPFGVALVILGACSTSRPEDTSGVQGAGGSSGNTSSCGTPNQGCPCQGEGQAVACGTVEYTSGDYVSCSMGTRTCTGGVWGQCNGTNVVTTKSAPVGLGSVHTLGFGDGGPCPQPPSPLANVCDPYCNNFVDDPIGLPFPDGGGLSLIEGGITITPNVVDAGDAGVQGGGPPIKTGTNGQNTCSGGTDDFTNPCNAGNADKNCQQDFHCDLNAASPTFQTCVWSEPSFYKDPACNGVDLTIGNGCDDGTGYLLPVCNRGNATLSAGAVIKIATTNTGTYNTWNSNCGGGTAPSCSFTLSSPLAPGECVTTNACPGGGGLMHAIVNSDNSIQECGAPGAGCQNNGAAIKNVGTGCQTCACNSGTAELTGTILDPAKLRAVYGATLYVPSTPVTAFPPNVGCDTCANIYSGLPALASTTTDVDGKFRLQGVPAGVSFPVVLQLGRFRRQFTVGPIGPCASATLGAAQSHMPATHTKTGDTAGDSVAPDLPKIAMITGSGDATECLLARMGFDTSEFTAPTGSGSIHMWTYLKSNGLQGGPGTYGAGSQVSGGSGPADVLLGNAATLGDYNAVVMPCSNQSDGQHPTAGMVSNLQSWIDGGGRLFASHISALDFLERPGGAYSGVANWSTPDVPNWAANSPDNNDRVGAYSLTDNVNTSFPYGVALARWLPIAWAAPGGGPGGPVPSFGSLPLTNWRNDVSAANGSTTSWFSGTSTYTGPGHGLQHNMLSFDAPIGAPPASQCGRAVLPFMHVSSSSSGTFPGSCGTVPGALTGQELSFEYMMWQSMTCLAPSTVPPTAPPPTPTVPAPLSPVTFVRDFDAVCLPGFQVKWQFFYWQALVLAGTLDFRAATADTQAALPSDPPAAAPTTVPIGTASTTILPPVWGQDARTVSDHLLNDPTPNGGSQSKEWLRVFMTFNPVGPLAPVLYNWRQTYDCVPSE